MNTQQHDHPFGLMSGESRIWVYQSNRLLATEEVQVVERELQHFLSEWTSHGAQMTAKAVLYHDCVLVIALNESKASASGCGIDKCVRFIDQLGKQMNMDWLSRNGVVYLQGEEVKLATISQFWAMRKANIIDEETLLIDPTIQKLNGWPTQGWVMFKKSWHQEMWGR